MKYNRPSLLGNIFGNIYDKKIHCGNIIDKITDHLPNFVIIKNIEISYKNKNLKSKI